LFIYGFNNDLMMSHFRKQEGLYRWYNYQF